MALHLAAPLRLLGGKDLRHQSVLGMDVAMRKHARCVRSGERGFAKTATTTRGEGRTVAMGDGGRWNTRRSGRLRLLWQAPAAPGRDPRQLQWADGRGQMRTDAL